MPTLGARPHSACGVRRAQAPVMSTTSRLRRHTFFLRHAKFQPLAASLPIPPSWRGSSRSGFAAASCRGQRHADVVSPQKRENKGIVHFTFGARRGKAGVALRTSHGPHEDNTYQCALVGGRPQRHRTGIGGRRGRRGGRKKKVFKQKWKFRSRGVCFVVMFYLWDDNFVRNGCFLGAVLTGKNKEAHTRGGHHKLALEPACHESPRVLSSTVQRLKG